MKLNKSKKESKTKTIKNKTNKLEKILKEKLKTYNVKINKDLLGGGFCPSDKPCDDMTIKVNVTDGINRALDTIFIPINLLINKLSFIIGDCIDLWNTIIHSVSTIIDDLFINLIFGINGYVSSINILLKQYKDILKIGSLLLSGDPIAIIVVTLIPLFGEIFDYLFDITTIDLITEMASFNLTPLKKYFVALFNFFTGKTVKPHCNVNDYSSKEEMDRYCHEYRNPSGRMNITTLYYLTLGILFIVYISGWFCFLKIFY